MKIKFKPIYLIGICVGLFIIIADFYLFFDFSKLEVKARWFYPILIVALNIGWSQLWIDFFLDIKRQKRVEEKFLDFVRSLLGNVKSGISIPNSIIQAGKDDYSELNPFIKKLVNQITAGIPVRQALLTFANDTENKTIKRAVNIIIEAEESGGDIEQVLASVTDSVVSEKKMKEERKSATFSQIVQGYIVFIAFIGIMLLVQLKLFPSLSKIGAGGGTFGGLFGSMRFDPAAIKELSHVFFIMILIQGFFAGLMIGKFSEGTAKQGLIHSLVLVTLAALILTTAGVV